jgi:hypothetical protein
VLVLQPIGQFRDFLVPPSERLGLLRAAKVVLKEALDTCREALGRYAPDELRNEIAMDSDVLEEDAGRGRPPRRVG